MEKNIPDKRTERIWAAVFLLLAAALITLAITAGIIIPRFTDSDNSIELESDGEKHVFISSITDGEGSGDAARSYALKHPGIEVEDENGVIWTSKMKRVEIFHLKYLGKDGYSVTVESSDKDKLVAPGTSNSYDFTVRNTGDTNLSYILTAETRTDGGMHIPLEIRLKNGEKLIKKQGIYTDSKGWADFEAFDGTKDSGTLKTKNSVSYTLDWKWPFGNAWSDRSGEDTAEDGLENATEKDIYDTILGNMAVNEDLTVTVELHLLASYESPKTGDDVNLMIWIIVFVASICLLAGIWLLIHKRKEDDQDESE